MYKNNMILRKLWQNYKCKNQIVKYYHCHQRGCKGPPPIKTTSIKPYQENDTNQDKKYMLYKCYFLSNIVKTIRHNNCNRNI